MIGHNHVTLLGTISARGVELRPVETTGTLIATCRLCVAGGALAARRHTITRCPHPDRHRGVRTCAGCGIDFLCCRTCHVGQVLCPACARVHVCGHLGADQIADDAGTAFCARCRYESRLGPSARGTRG